MYKKINGCYVQCNHIDGKVFSSLVKLDNVHLITGSPERMALQRPASIEPNDSDDQTDTVSDSDASPLLRPISPTPTVSPMAVSSPRLSVDETSLKEEEVKKKKASEFY